MSGNKQIGWSQESNLLWDISKELQKFTAVLSKVNSTTPIRVPVREFSGYISFTPGIAPKIDIEIQNDFTDLAFINNGDSGDYTIRSESGEFTSNNEIIITNIYDLSGRAYYPTVTSFDDGNIYFSVFQSSNSKVIGLNTSSIVFVSIKCY